MAKKSIRKSIRLVLMLFVFFCVGLVISKPVHATESTISFGPEDYWDISVDEVVEYSGPNTQIYYGIWENDVFDDYDCPEPLEGTNYRVIYSNNDKVGTATMTIQGMGGYSFSRTFQFQIVPKQLVDCYYEIEGQDYYDYTGKPIEPKTVIYQHPWWNYNEEIYLTEGVDYTLSYERNLNAGFAEIVIHGIGNYTGTVREDSVLGFSIYPVNINNLSVSGVKTQTYNPSNKYTQKPVIKYNGMTLVEGHDYECDVRKSTYGSNGVYYGQIDISSFGCPSGNYDGSRTVSFKILPADISKATVEGLKNVTYNGSRITQNFEVYYGDYELTDDDDYYYDEGDYSVTYKNNKECGTATVIINGENKFKGSLTKTFKINHKLNRVKAKAATCTKAGNKEYWQCTGCKKVFSDSKGTTETTIAAMTIKAKGHSYGAWTKLNDTQHQRVCKNDKSHVQKANHGWDSGKITKNATCGVAGVKTFTCSTCKGTKTQSVAATGKHTWDKGKVTKQATVTATGVKTYTCTVCKKTKTETIPKVKVPTIGLRRIYGGSRYTTSFAIAEQYMKDSGQQKLNNIIVACGINFPDALAGSYLSKIKKAPIIVWNVGINKDVQTFIKQKVKSGGTVYILGGTSAVGDAVKTNMSGYKFVRLADSNRYGTNIKILNAAGINKEELLVCDGTQFVNALIASGTGKPILLVPKGGLTAQQKTWLNSNKSKITRATIIGDAASVDLKAEIDLEKYIKTVERVSAKNADVMSAKVAKRYFANPEEVVIAISENFPDGLCGGPLAIVNKGPVLLVTDESCSNSVEFVSQKTTIKRATVLGGPGLVSNATVKRIARNSNAKWEVIQK